MPTFYRPLLRWIGAIPIPGTTSWRGGSSEEYTVTYVPEPGNELKDLGRDISNEVLGEIAGIVADEHDVHAIVGRRGDLEEFHERVEDLLNVTDWTGKVPAVVAAAQALCTRLGFGFSPEEIGDLPPGGWGQGSMVVGHGKLP